MPPDAPIFFVDRCLGAHIVPEALRSAGARVECHAEHFADDAPDPEILAVVGERQWIFLSKDTRIRRRKAEIDALIEANVVAFILTSGNATGADLAAALVKALAKMTRVYSTYTHPLIASVTLSGAVTVFHGERRGGVRR